jgi:hypothetical protein
VEGVKVAMTGWRRVRGLMMLKVYRAWEDPPDEADVSVEREAGVATAVCLRAQRTVVVVMPSASVWTKS